MNKRVKLIILIYLIIIIILGGIPFIVIKNDSLKISLDIIRTISIFATSIFAIIYFDPFGIRKKGKEKNYENILKILEIIKTQVLIFDTNNDKIKSFQGFQLTKKNIEEALKTKKRYDHDFKELDLIIKVNYEDFTAGNLSLTELKNSIWTPKEIEEKMNFLNPGFFANTREIKEYTYISWTRKKEENLIHIMGTKEFTLYEFLNEYYTLINECNNWLAKNYFLNNNINI